MVVVTDTDPAVIYPVPNCWPAAQCNRPDAVVCTLIAGYELLTDNTYDAPEAINLGVQHLVQGFMDGRGISSVEVRPDSPNLQFVKDLLAGVVRTVAAPSSLPIRPLFHRLLVGPGLVPENLRFCVCV